MGEFDRALRQMKRAALACPRCEAENIPRRAPQITVDERGEAECSVCSMHWQIPIQNLAGT